MNENKNMRIEDAIGISTALNISPLLLLNEELSKKYNNPDLLLEEYNVPYRYYSIKTGQEVS